MTFAPEIKKGEVNHSNMTGKYFTQHLLLPDDQTEHATTKLVTHLLSQGELAFGQSSQLQRKQRRFLPEGEK